MLELSAGVLGYSIASALEAAVLHFGASAVDRFRSSSRPPTDPLIAGPFRSRFPSPRLTGMTLRLGISACTGNPEG